MYATREVKRKLTIYVKHVTVMPNVGANMTDRPVICVLFGITPFYEFFDQ